MEIIYKRELKHNYLCMEPDQPGLQCYETRILMDNSVEGLLKFRIKLIDDKNYFYYEITSRQPLSRILEHRSITPAEIRSLILGILAVINRMETYLLKEEMIMLEPEYLYVEPESFEIYLCVVPGYHGDFPKALTKLLQYILGKVDHQDKECVIMAYGLYQESLKENYGMDNLMKYLQVDEKPVKEEEKREPEKPELIEEWEEEPDRRPSTPVAAVRKFQWIPILAAVVAGPAVAWLIKGFSGLMDTWWLLLALDGIVFARSVLLWNRKEEPVHEEDFHMIFKEEDMEQEMEREEPTVFRERPENDTVLLVNLESGCGEAKLVSLDGEEDVEIDYFPFVIGKQQSLVDYVLDRDHVSRLHLRIDREGEEYRITDLNSTNGTYVNSYPLNANETAVIQNMDEIKIADLRYQFIVLLKN